MNYIGIRKRPVETRMYYCKSRYYVPQWCRWLTADSIDYLDPASIVGLNLYAYCYNDPISKGSNNFESFIIRFAQHGHQGNMRKSKYASWSIEQLLERYDELCSKGRLTNEEKKEKKDIETELKARGERNKSKRKGYSHSHIYYNRNFNLGKVGNFNKYSYNQSNINNSFIELSFRATIGITITYIIANDSTGVGVIDDFALIVLIPLLFILK